MVPETLRRRAFNAAILTGFAVGFAARFDAGRQEHSESSLLKLTNDLIATEIAGEVGSMSAGAVVEFVRDQVFGVPRKPLE